MAFEQLFIRVKKSIGGISLDAVISEAHNTVVRKTTNPVELGADITDHAIIEPDKINIIAEVSDTPLGAAAIGQIVDLITGLFGTSTSNDITRSNAAYNTMVQLQKAREPIDVQTKLKLYQNMLITSITNVQDKTSSRIVNMNIALEEVLITQSEIIQLEPEQLPEGTTREQASAAEKKGRQEPVVPDSSTNTSVIKTITNWVSN